MTDLTVVAIFRNEAPYLAEFIAFHLAQGAGRFALYNNRSTDDWYRALEPFADVVDVVDWPMESAAQMPAYFDYFQGVQRGQFAPSRWAAVLDVDEFLFTALDEPKPLVDVLDEYGRVGAAGVGVNWMIYNGAEANEVPPPPPVLQIEAYLHRCDAGHGANRHIKSIVDPMRVAAIQDPHSFRMRGPVCDELGRILPGPYTQSPTHTRLRINHYLIRSRQEWAEKVARGRADTGGKRDFAELEQYPVMATDAAAARFAPAVRAILAERGILEREGAFA